MGNYVFSIKIGLIIFPILALLITVPYMIIQYNKYGSIPYLKSLIVYLFVLYLLEAYFMVILPLPNITAVKYYTSDWAQLIPFNFVSEIGNNVKFNSLNFVKHPLVYQLIFNIFLTVPFGMFLRYYFKRNIKEVLILSLLLSLFFEVTQITGLYGLYPRPYRLFDVDDLISNTLGGVLGYLLTPLFTFFLPSKDKLDEKAIEESSYVSTPRKIIANIIDFSIVYLVYMLAVNITLVQEILLLSTIILLYYIISTYFLKGYTIGKYIVRIRLVDNYDNRPKLYQLLIRYQIIYMIFFEVYFIFYYFEIRWISYLLIVMVVFLYFYNLICVFYKKKGLIYDILSKTKHISTKK